MTSNPRSFASSVARAWKSLTRRPAYFAIAVSSLAIALGLATTVIAQIDSLMHPYSPIRDVDRVRRVSLTGIGLRGNPSKLELQNAFISTGLFESIVPVSELGYSPTPGVETHVGGVTMAGRQYQNLLGMSPRLGRLFADDETLNAGVAVVTDAFWRRNYGNATAINRATVTLESTPVQATKRTFEIIGVLPPEWNGVVSVIIPRPAGEDSSTRSAPRQFVARLREGVRDQQADTVLRSLANRFAQQFGQGRWPFGARQRSMRPDPLQIRDFNAAMIGAALFILIIAASNVSALTLARGVTNRRNQALRLALGAGKRDLLRDVTAEVGILALLGGLGGVAIAYAAMGIMTAVTPVDLAWLGFSRPNLSPRVFAGLFAAVALSVTIAAIGPALATLRIAPAEPLKESAGTTTGRMHSRFKFLVVGELALAMVLLFGGSLISKTAQRVATFDFGYEPRGLARIWTSARAVPRFSPPPKDQRMAPYWPAEVLSNELDVMADRLRSLPEVQDAAWYGEDMAINRVVMSEATSVLDSSLYNPVIFSVGPRFLSTLGVTIVEGRDFVDGDRVDGATILDAISARRLFPDGSAIGRMVKFGPLASPARWVRVVGVANTAVHELPEQAEMEQRPVIYVSRERWGNFNFLVRARREVGDIGPVAMRTIRDLVPERAGVGVDKWSRKYDAVLAGRRFTAGIFGTLSLASLALATAGLFGVLSYSVSQRMREFSLRVALGAQKPHMLRLVFRDSLVMALGGTAIGALVGLYAGFAVYDWLWGVYPVDATALVIAESVLLVVTITASALPALRATRANPADVMRAI